MRDIASPLDGFASPFGPGRRTLTNLLFGQNEPGFTFEPWDMTTLYQDRAGTTPVTAVGQSVGKRLDKSGRGNHEVAINDAARGVYGREPIGGTRNRLTYTEQFDNAAWTKSVATVTPNAAVAPDGATTADLVAGGGFVRQQYSISASAVRYTYSVYAKASANTSFAVTEAGATSSSASFTLSGEGAVVISNLGGSPSGTILNVGDGWYRCTFSYTTNGVQTILYLNNIATSAFLWGAQLELGASATAYQKVVSQYDITEAGVPSCYYVQTDGVDDAYVTPTITPGTDKVQVFAGVRKNSDAAIGIVVEHSATIASNNGAFYIAAPITAGAANYHFVSKGTGPVSATYTNAAVAAPSTNVITGLGDISGDTATLRINGTQVAQATTDQGTGNYLAYPAYIYARGGTTLPFNGRDYGHAVRFGPNLDAATIARVEALIARNTPTVTL